MARPRRSALSDAVHDALDDKGRATPTAQLSLVYAARIDDAGHVPAALERALRVVRGACLAADNPLPALDALDKICAALSAVTVTAELGPKLLAALDALLLTPKALAAVDALLISPKAKPGGDAKPANPLQDLRDEEDELKARRDRRPAR